MSKSNPTASPDAPNFEVVGNIIHRYEPMDISEAFGVLSQVKNPLCGFRDADFQPWVKSRLHYVHPTAAEPFRTKSEKYQQCARITAEERIQLTDTQLLDKLEETEMKLENGSQLWQVFTDRDDPQMTLREAIEVWGADE